MRRRLATLLVLLVALAAPAADAAAAGDPLRPQQWGLDMVEADAAHRVTRGDGALVAVLDSGARLGHPDLAGRLVAGRDFVERDDRPEDADGHGTHVAGIVAAATGNDVGVAGVAPLSRVLVVRVLDEKGEGDADTIAEGIDYAVDRGVDVINLSLGETVPLSPLGFGGSFEDALDRALDRGVIVVAAAGNNGVPVCEQPAGEGRLLCVGSVDRRRQRSAFSSFGTGLGLVAPGGGIGARADDILSTYLRPDYEFLAGTSFAAPHVAGVAALLVSRGVRGQDAVRRIVETATDLGPPGRDAEYGAGLVNARAAVTGVGRTGAASEAASALSDAGRVSIPRQRIRTVLRRGLRVRCRPAHTGRCRVTASRGRLRLAAGSRRARAGRTTTVTAQTTARGRRALRRARRVGVRVRVVLPGPESLTLRVVLRR